MSTSTHTVKFKLVWKFRPKERAKLKDCEPTVHRWYAHSKECACGKRLKTASGQIIKKDAKRLTVLA